MPELPEVETVKTILKPLVLHHKITKIDVLRKSTILHSASQFQIALEGEEFLDITRIGKFLIFHLTHDKVFLSHLRMEGKFFQVKEEEDNTKYARVVFHLNNGYKICYDDSRCFGIMKLSDESNYRQEKEIASLGPEPFDIKDVNYLLERVKKSNLPIKSVLLDQTLMTGLGNIYDDEVLFACRIHPLTPAKLITKSEWENILSQSVRILHEAIQAGGSTIRSYHPGKDIDGNFQSSLLAYGHHDDDCPRCHHPMRYIKVNGRGSTYCPICQVKKGLPISIAIFGLVGSGKSHVLQAFQVAGYASLSCDEVVNELYQDQEVAHHIIEMFSLPEADAIDKNMLRDYLLHHEKDKKKLERYIHPLVKKRVAAFLKSHPFAVVEVPLLFEAKMEAMFDILLAVEAKEEIRLARLKKRNPQSGLALAKINHQDNQFESQKRKADFIINNDAGLEEFDKQIHKIINILAHRQN